ncbi:MAG: hypothetical protein HC828_18915 [Blastochloris sp.]|nr:hypothetical protein [Blastochloris sp.]
MDAFFSVDETEIIAVAKGYPLVTIWDIKTGLLERTLDHEANITAFQISPDGSKIATGGVDGSVRIWDLSGENPIMVFSGLTGQVSSLDFNSNGSQIAFGSFGGEVRIGNIETREEINFFAPGLNQEVRARVLHVSFSALETALLATSDNFEAYTWNIATATQGPTFTITGHTDAVTDGFFSPNTDFLGWVVTASADRRVQVRSIFDESIRFFS